MDNGSERVAAEAPAQSRRGLSLSAILAILGLIAFVAVAALFGIALIDKNRTQPTSGKAPDFSLSTFDGKTVSLSDLRGKVVVINFWASWCAPCRDEAPDLQRTWERYQERGVVFLGIAYTDTERNALAFVKQSGATYPNGLDIGTRISARYRIQGVPETFIIDRDGNVVEFVMAPLTEVELSASLERALAQGGTASR
jgi:cytochrome c biogenesis protein CcmG/thiol:disulfide interchange protein DsbE